MPKKEVERTPVLSADEIIQDLNNQFEHIGMAKTRLSRWTLKKAKHVARVKGYIEKMSEAALLDKSALSMNNSRNKVKNAKNRQILQESSLIDKVYKGVSNLFYAAVMPVWTALGELFYYRRRPLYNALRLGLAFLIMGGIIAAIVLFPPILAPILLELTVLLGGLYLLGTAALAIIGVLTFRLIFGATTLLADRLDLGEGYYLSTPQVDLWQENTNLSEDTLKIIKQYILNTAKNTPDKNARFTLTQLLQNEFTVPSESSLKKLSIFFMEQLKDLKYEQQKRPHTQDKQLELDIKVVNFILDQFGYIELLPKVTRDEIEVVLGHKLVAPLLASSPLSPSQPRPSPQVIPAPEVEPEHEPEPNKSFFKRFLKPSNKQ